MSCGSIPRKIEILLTLNYIGKVFAALRTLRLFLPAYDNADLPVSWSSMLPAGTELSASTDGTELVSDQLAKNPGVLLPSAPLGRLSRDVANALGDILGSWVNSASLLRTRSWVGYSGPFTGSVATSFFGGHEYLQEEISLEEIIFRSVRDQVPAFVEDPHGVFAWDTGLYPDPLIIAAVPELFKAFHQDPRLKVFTIASN